MLHQTNVEGYFHKCFEFIGNSHWILPTEAYKTQPWEISNLLKMKKELNDVKNQLSNFNLEQWSEHTKFRDPSSFIIPTLKSKANIELLTQAWCKFYECLCQYPIIPEIAVDQHKLTSLHLCEAPGAFISALNRFLYTHYRGIDWEWNASTLNPYYEGNPVSDMIADDRLIRHTLSHWDFGVDLTGDLTKYYNHKILINNGHPMLVTADGSVDCMSDPGEQENHVHYLHYCETMTALRVLVKGGTFVIKLFTIFEHGTICLLYLLNCCFLKVHIFKPCSSKSGNSEVYVICIKYKGWEIVDELWPSLIAPYRGLINKDKFAAFPLESLNEEFLQQIENCSSFFMQLQCHTINQNVLHFSGQKENDDVEVNLIKTRVAERYVKKCRLAFHIPKRYNLIANYKKYKATEELDLTVINIIDLPMPQENLLQVKIGLALTCVTNSKFCNIDFKSCKIENSDNVEILEEILPLISSQYKVFQNLESTPQYIYQRNLFNLFVNNLKPSLDIVLLRIPLLTKFLVGLLYILAQGFTTTTISKKGFIVLKNSTAEKLGVVQRYLDIIGNGFLHSKNETDFTADIQEVISSELFENEGFIRMINVYNNGIYSK